MFHDVGSAVSLLGYIILSQISFVSFVSIVKYYLEP